MLLSLQVLMAAVFRLKSSLIFGNVFWGMAKPRAQACGLCYKLFKVGCIFCCEHAKILEYAALLVTDICIFCTALVSQFTNPSCLYYKPLIRQWSLTIYQHRVFRNSQSTLSFKNRFQFLP